MAFKTIFVPTLFLAHLAEPAEFLKSFCLYSNANGFGCEEVMLAHGGNQCGAGATLNLVKFWDFCPFHSYT